MSNDIELHRDDVVLNGEVIRDYMSSLEFMTPAERSRIIKALKKQNEEQEKHEHD